MESWPGPDKRPEPRSNLTYNLDKDESPFWFCEPLQIFFFFDTAHGNSFPAWITIMTKAQHRMWDMFWRWFSIVCVRICMSVCKREREGKNKRERLVWHVSDRTRIATQAGSSSCRDVGVSQPNSSVKHVSHYNCLFFRSSNPMGWKTNLFKLDQTVNDT